MKNPFEITKAVDFTDEQIADNWVDLPGGGFSSLADPCSPMPKFLVGGKGGGRTHLLRYFSYPLQRLRYKSDLVRGIQEDGYVGIYFRCGGLNSSRFSGKRQDPDTWAAVFSYYTEIWLGRLALDLITDLHSASTSKSNEDEASRFVKAVVSLFDVELPLDPGDGEPLQALTNAFQKTQKQLDIAINNAALSHSLDVSIPVTPGRLVFGIPAAASQHLPTFSGIIFAYLLDEFENLTIEQQRYVNTLIREKQLPTTFLVGSRQWGLRTHVTLSAGEENKQGSEYELTVLEEIYRAKDHSYPRFCESIVRKRLHSVGIDTGSSPSLYDYFAKPGDNGVLLEEQAKLHSGRRINPDVRPPWIVRLESQLSSSGNTGNVPNLLALVSFPESPLHEKLAIFLFYRAWADGRNLVEAARANRHDIEQLLASSDGNSLSTTYKHYQRDLYAQLLEELNLDQEYYGLEDLIRMSGFLPRNLIVLLKQVTRWSIFLGEKPFRGEKVSQKAQKEGVREASKWFLSDAKGLGLVGEETQVAVRRLGSLLRDMRFSDKPVEVSCSTFATDRQGLSPLATRSLDAAISHSLILEVPKGRLERNSQVLQHKYQLNPMLAPMFKLSLARRGSANFSAAVLNAIFDPGVSESDYNSFRRLLLSRLQAPFTAEPAQEQLFFE